MAEQDIFPCGYKDESRFSPDFEIPLSTMELQVLGDPSMAREVLHRDLGKRKRRLEGPAGQVISDLLGLIKAHNPDIILLPHADTWIPL